MATRDLRHQTVILSNDVIDLVQLPNGQQYELHEYSEIIGISQSDILKTLPIIYIQNVYEIED